VTPILCREDHSCLPPASVDLVFICDTYHHFEYPQKTMASIHRALRPGGRLIVVDFERIPGRSSGWTLQHVRAGRETVLEELKTAGFGSPERLLADDLVDNYMVRLTRIPVTNR
jgi:predicted methyltransferase